MDIEHKEWDMLIKNARVFDGLGGPPRDIDVATKNGKIAALGRDLNPGLASETIEGSGQWLMPGMIDIHTHFDLEVEVAPELPEAVRHGTTSVVMSNCSLGTAFGAQLNPDNPDENPILDCFARVENIPKSVLAKCVERIDWHDTGDYLKHLDELPLGPNVAPMLPHTMLRIEVMGLEDSISRQPSDEEIDQMVALVEKAMKEGYVGFSSDGLPLHYLANDPHRNARIPAQHAPWKEIKALGNVVRKYNRTWQATPDPDDMLTTIRTFGMTSARLYGQPLRITATAAMDLHANKRGASGLINFSKILNSRLLKGDFTFQALSAPFKVWADGVTTPLLEEKPAFRELNACDVHDRESRLKLLNDPSFQERFRKDWREGKDGYNLARLKRKMEIEPTTFSRDLDEMFIESCPVECWSQQNVGDIYRRLETYQASHGQHGAQNDEEAAAFALFPNPIRDDAEFMLHMLREYDHGFRWHTTTANGKRPDVLKKLVFHEETIPGFNDSGAHLTNMAYYDGNLLTLKMAAEDSIELVSFAVKRLTHDAAALFGLDLGTIEVDAQADLVLIDPQALLQYNSDANITTIYRDIFEYEQMVNRSEGVVTKVLIAGKLAWDGQDYVPEFGKEKFGRALRSIYCAEHNTAETESPEQRLSA